MGTCLCNCYFLEDEWVSTWAHQNTGTLPPWNKTSIHLTPWYECSPVSWQSVPRPKSRSNYYILHLLVFPIIGSKALEPAVALLLTEDVTTQDITEHQNSESARHIHSRPHLPQMSASYRRCRTYDFPLPSLQAMLMIHDKANMWDFWVWSLATVSLLVDVGFPWQGSWGYWVKSSDHNDKIHKN